MTGWAPPQSKRPEKYCHYSRRGSRSRTHLLWVDEFSLPTDTFPLLFSWLSLFLSFTLCPHASITLPSCLHHLLFFMVSHRLFLCCFLSPPQLCASLSLSHIIFYHFPLPFLCFYFSASTFCLSLPPGFFFSVLVLEICFPLSSHNQ